MMIKIKNLRLQPVIGVYAHERIAKQDIIVNMEITYDASAAIASDDLKDALDYDSIKTQVIALVEGSRFHLIEHMAGQIIGIVLKDERVKSATVEVDKPDAVKEADSVSFTLTKPGK